jgi:ABC-type lipoprotein release transport system permease subunit
MKEQKKYTKILMAWVFAWVVSTAFLSYGVNFLWDNLLITKIGLLINLAIGVGMIIANKNLFKHYDELQKKIQFDAMALTLGLAVVVGLVYEISFDFGVIDSEPEFEYLVFFICFSYITSTIINSLKYK